MLYVLPHVTMWTFMDYMTICVLLVEPLRAIPYDPHGLRCCACSALAKCSLAAAALEASGLSATNISEIISQVMTVMSEISAISRTKIG